MHGVHSNLTAIVNRVPPTLILALIVKRVEGELAEVGFPLLGRELRIPIQIRADLSVIGCISVNVKVIEADGIVLVSQFSGLLGNCRSVPVVVRFIYVGSC